MTEATSMLQLLTPRRVAVLGASDNPVKAGGRPIAYMRRYGFQGDIYPVNPRRTEVQGLPCYASLADLPQAPDLVVISLAGSQVDAALAQCIAAGARCAVIYASGFAELGAAGLAAQQALMRRASAAGLRLIGPNTQGVANFQTGAVLNFSTMINECAPQDGAIAIVSQSGAGAGILYGGLRRQGLGVRYMVATGNEADVNVARAVRGLLEDPSLRLILMYAEALRDTGLLAEAAALSARRDVPILAVKAARTPAGQATASSHRRAGQRRCVDRSLSAPTQHRPCARFRRTGGVCAVVRAARTPPGPPARGAQQLRRDLRAGRRRDRTKRHAVGRIHTKPCAGAAGSAASVCRGAQPDRHDDGAARAAGHLRRGLAQRGRQRRRAWRFRGLSGRRRRL
nr:CoA-binding protein [Verminephrobacter eiseniae]